MRINQLSLNLLLLLPLMVTSLAGTSIRDAGLMLGINLAKIRGSNFGEDMNLKIGPSVGGYAIFDLHLPAHLRIEGWYSEKGYQLIEPIVYMDEDGDRGSYTIESISNTHYIAVNTMGVIPLTERISTHMGLTFSRFLKGDWKRDVVDLEGPSSEWLCDLINSAEGEGNLGTSDVFKSDIGLVLGIVFYKKPMSLEVRLNLGLRQVYRNHPGKNTVAQFLMVYRFGK